MTTKTCRTFLFLFIAMLFPPLLTVSQGQEEDTATTPESAENAPTPEEGVTPAGDAEPGETPTPKRQGPQSTSQNARKILALHQKDFAGGTDLDRIQSLRIEGKMREGRNDYTFVIYKKRPHFYRMERTRKYLGREYVTYFIFDGETYWSQEIRPKRQPHVPINPNQARYALRESTLFGPLIDWEEQGHNFAYEGTEMFGDYKTYILEAGFADGDSATYYIDAQRFFVRGLLFTDRFAGQPVDADRYPRRFERIEGIRLPTEIHYLVGRDTYKEVTYTKFEFNIPVPDSLFERPKAKVLLYNDQVKR